jgi:5-methylcytosine-specific restriction endonuclease McrA
MPTAPGAACLTPRCPGRAVPGGRGRCASCRRTTSERGYGSAWQGISRAQRLAAPQCAECGTTDDLVADHVRNGDARHTQTLCRSCNTAKRNRERTGGEGSGRASNARIADPGGRLRTRPGIADLVTRGVRP